MQIKLLMEEGYEIALMGLGLSHKKESVPLDEWWDYKKFQRMQKVAEICAKKGGGHDKFLESITVWVYIKAPINWWVEFDTYRVGTTKQSASTMHTLMKEEVTQEHFNTEVSPALIVMLNHMIKSKATIEAVKDSLPTGYLQSRIVCTNYKVLKNIIAQRRWHRLPSWTIFIDAIEEMVQHPELIT